MGSAEAEALEQQLRRAIDDEDWGGVIRLVEAEWPVLMAVAVSALDAALHALPPEMWVAHPTAAAVRECRLNVHGDTSDLDRLAMNTLLPSQPSDLRKVGRSGSARRAMSTAAAFMLAYRLHGQYRKALHFATITEELTRHARVAQPGRIAIRVPSAILQVGITRLLAGDYHRASLLLREAYELRDETWDGRVGGDAAGKLALLFATRGQTIEAERWLSRHDHGARSLGWMIPLVQLSAKVAAVLISVDRLDQSAAEAALRELELQVNRERSWAPFVTYARSRYDLLWGDPRAALNRIDRTRAFTGAQHRSAGIEPRLDAVKADLLLAVGRTGEAQELLADRQSSPDLAPVAARLALLADRRSAAREHIAAGLAADEIDLRAQIDLLITSAVAEDSPVSGHRHLQQAIAAAAHNHSYSSFALARRSSLNDVVTAMDTADRAKVEKILSRAPEPLPQSIDLVELTSTEEKVLALLAAGEPRPKMAQLLFVSENTVKFHVRNLYRKLGADSREDALARAHQLRLLPINDA